ncbi:MAG: hypothetical protein GY708_15570 [Actinomycetia bacterium]|nr:hypothetical protein [Actinomycetes bacterium]MCP4960681.1 hypothetical protein [Actinomycetes bacterium]
MDAKLRVLFMCTGNICRSTMAEYMLNGAARDRGLPLVARSAGLAAPEQPPPPHTLSVLDERGLDARAHRSRSITQELVGSADLILTMTGRHAREAALLDMESIPRIFTLREFGKRLSIAGPRHPGQEVAGYISMIGEGRMSSQLGSGGSGDDIADPYGRRKRAYKQAAAEIETEIQKTLVALYP